MTQGVFIFINIIITIGSSVYFSYTTTGTSGVIATFAVGAYVLLLQLLLLTETSNKNSLDKVLSALKIEKELYNYDWTFSALQKVATIYTHPNSTLMFIDKCIKDSITEGIQNAENILQNGKKLPLGRDKEIDRQQWLLHAIENSKKYVYAVTSCNQEYIDSFWIRNKKFANTYINANIEAANRGVEIHRIFILPEQTSENSDLFSKITSIIRPMVAENIPKKLKVSVVLNEAMKEISNCNENNFIVVDNIFCGATDNFSENHNGYISICQDSVINNLKKTFKKLELVASHPQDCGLNF
jgi:hypothetical protein